MVELLALYWDTQTQANAISQAVERALSVRRPAVHAPRPRVVQRRLNAEVRQDLVAAYRAGVGVKVLAARFGVHRQTVSAILQREQVPLRRRGLSPDQIAGAAVLYRQGWSLARLGERFGVDPTTARRVLVAEGVSMRSPNERAG